MQRAAQLRCLLWAWNVLLVVGCAPTYHTPPVYRFDHLSAALIEQHASAACADAKEPTRAFVTDGCTLWPDGWWTGRSWQQCCERHDEAYWCGGTDDDRKQADQALLECVESEYAFCTEVIGLE